MRQSITSAQPAGCVTFLPVENLERGGGFLERSPTKCRLGSHCLKDYSECVSFFSNEESTSLDKPSPGHSCFVRSRRQGLKVAQYALILLDLCPYYPQSRRSLFISSKRPSLKGHIPCNLYREMSAIGTVLHVISLKANTLFAQQSQLFFGRDLVEKMRAPLYIYHFRHIELSRFFFFFLGLKI
jgi:hypothetical protein